MPDKAEVSRCPAERIVAVQRHSRDILFALFDSLTSLARSLFVITSLFDIYKFENHLDLQNLFAMGNHLLIFQAHLIHECYE